MEKIEFNKKVKEVKKGLINGSAVDVRDAIETQYHYRNHGIFDLTFDELLTEIAKARVIGVDFIDSIDIEEEIKEL